MINCYDKLRLLEEGAMPKTQKFEGRSFRYYDSHRTKGAAERTANTLRKEGWLARITKVSSEKYYFPWIVWRRKK